MTRLIIPALVALLVSGLAGSSYAKDGERLPNFKQLCIEDASTGFIWRNGGWEHVRFKPDTYVLSKITPPRDQAEAIEKGLGMAKVNCTNTFAEKEETDSENFKIYNSCLKLQKVGEKHARYMGCVEGYTKYKGNWGGWFECKSDGFDFQPNGHFHSGVIHGSLQPKPKDDKKDRLTV